MQCGYLHGIHWYFPETVFHLRPVMVIFNI
jgi:hypothetical protein